MVAAAATTVLATALPAAGHVTVSSPDAAPGGFGKLVFSVPNESDTAGTVGVTVQLPARTPFAFVSVKPKPGWSVETTEQKLPESVEVGDFTVGKAVTKVTWTATGDTDIAAGEFDEFELAVGPFPESADELMFPASQRYSDGEVVDWDEPTPASGKEPEHPAPLLALGADEPAAGDAAEGGGVEGDSVEGDSVEGDSVEGDSVEGDSVAAGETEVSTAASAQSAEADGSDGLARTLGGAGLALGVLAVGLAVGRRRPAS